MTLHPVFVNVDGKLARGEWYGVPSPTRPSMAPHASSKPLLVARLPHERVSVDPAAVERRFDVSCDPESRVLPGE